jgi:hypothetical protein
MIGSETFIIVALRCTENSTPCSCASRISRAEEGVQRGGAHDRRVDDLAGLHLQPVLEHGGRAVGADVLDAQRRRGVERHRRLGVAEVALGHRRDVALGVGAQAPIEWGCFLA